MKIFTLNINGKQHSISVEADAPLLWVLRDELGYTGTKFGCGRGLCGACTVHLDGEATRSCMTTVEFAEDSEITTIEGLSEDGTHPVQQAWFEEDVPQCGYCQPGQIMTAVSFLDRNPNPTEADIDSAMKMNICRCGTYPSIKKAINRVADKQVSADE